MQEPKQQYWSPIRFTMALPPDVGSALYDVIWEKLAGEQLLGGAPQRMEEQ
jgi:hypothetical protein